MGGLAHIIETAGLATVGISLVREHTAAMKPPRTLWVPFPLGRPLGEPNDEAFQLDVLRAVLARHPDSPPATLCLAGLLHRTGRDAGALSYLQALSDRSPDDYRVYGLMAQVYEAMGRDAEAAEADELYREKRRHQQVDRRVRGDLEAMLQIATGS